MNASDLTLAIRERTTCEEPMGSRTHQANRTNPVHFAQVEYAHVVAYFRSNLPNPVRSVARIAERLQEVPGKGEFEVLVWTSAGPVKRRGGSLAPLLAEAGQHPESERIRCVLIGRERRGAQAKLVDSLWHTDYLAEEVYEIAQSDCSVVSTIRLNGFLPDTASIEHEEDAKRVSSQSLSARAASRELIEDVVRLALGCPGVYYLLVDVAPMEETGAAGIYRDESHFHVSPRSLARHIEAKKWNRLREKRREFVRGVFWGNYLSPEMLDRLGGKEKFRRCYIDKAKQEIADWRSLVQDTPQGGLFVKISRDPLDEVEGRIGGELAVWLHDEFRRIGALL